MAKKPAGYYSKGKVNSQKAVAKANARKSLTSLKGIAGIVGGAVIEGIGGPKAKGAKIVGKTSAKLARAIAREAAGDKAKGMTVRKVPLYKLDKAKMTVKGGSSTTVKKGTSAKRAPLTKAEREKLNAVTVRYGSPKELKAAAKARQGAPRARLENVPAPSRKAYVPRANKTPRRARDVQNLGVGTDARLAKKRVAAEQAKAIARANRGNRPALAAKTKAAIRRTEERQKAQAARQKAETRFFTDKTPVKQYADKTERVIGSTTKGELRQLKVKTTRAAADPRNSLRGGKQGTIDQRQPRPRERMTEREIEIARIVGKRDYSRGEVNPLAQSTVQREADRRVGELFKSPKFRAQEAARVKAAIQKAKDDKELGASLRKNRKNFRGKPMK